MKEGIHPEYKDTVIKCACGALFVWDSIDPDDGDRIVAIDGSPVQAWSDIAPLVARIVVGRTCRAPTVGPARPALPSALTRTCWPAFSTR